MLGATVIVDPDLFWFVLEQQCWNLETAFIVVLHVVCFTAKPLCLALETTVIAGPFCASFCVTGTVSVILVGPVGERALFPSS